MIVYRLQCSKGHNFDEWFASSDDYAERTTNGASLARNAATPRSSKAIMAPQYRRRQKRRTRNLLHVVRRRRLLPVGRLAS